jgi:hypothetical protein
MKNQIMEYDRYVGMDRKYGAVRIQTLKNSPVTVSLPSFLLTLFLFSSNSLKTKAEVNETKIFNGS